MVFQLDKYGSSAPWCSVVRHIAQAMAVVALGKRCNTSARHRRVGLSASMSGQAEPHGGFRAAKEALCVQPTQVLRSLERATAITGSTRPTLNVDSSTASIRALLRARAGAYRLRRVLAHSAVDYRGRFAEQEGRWEITSARAVDCRGRFAKQEGRWETTSARAVVSRGRFAEQQGRWEITSARQHSRLARLVWLSQESRSPGDGHAYSRLARLVWLSQEGRSPDDGHAWEPSQHGMTFPRIGGRIARASCSCKTPSPSPYPLAAFEFVGNKFG